jgi:DNA-binding NarL/FixJ family response regulator
MPEAMACLATCHPDVVIVDIGLKSGSGIELIRRIKARDERIRILVLSMFPERLYAERAVRAGALGYVSKEHATTKIVEAIRCVSAGEFFLSKEMTDQLLQSAARKPATKGSPVESLSDRELEVFQLIGEGLTTREIAERLHLSIYTIETHRQRIRSKLRLRSGTELGRAAIQWVLETH